MGGSALSVPTRRITAQEFAGITAEIVGMLRAALPGARVAVVPSYRTKPDFGDIDILVEREAVHAAGGPALLEDLARNAWFSRASFRNGPVLSVEYRHGDEPVGCQVDLITAPSAEFRFHLDYLSYNDLGNLIGRVAHRMGFSYGQAGLIYRVRDGDHVFADLPLTLTTAAALRFMGYDPGRFASGFDTLEEIFEYVASSRYFAPELYLFENRNHAARTRDRKRKNYRLFLEWLAQGHTPKNKACFAWADRNDESMVAVERHALLLDARRRFPEFALQLVEVERRLFAARQAKAKFNGGLVMEWTGLCGQQLGALMRRLREGFASPEAMNAWVNTQEPAAIKAWVEREASKA